MMHCAYQITPIRLVLYFRDALGRPNKNQLRLLVHPSLAQARFSSGHICLEKHAWKRMKLRTVGGIIGNST